MTPFLLIMPYLISDAYKAMGFVDVGPGSIRCPIQSVFVGVPPAELLDQGLLGNGGRLHARNLTQSPYYSGDLAQN